MITGTSAPPMFRVMATWPEEGVCSGTIFTLVVVTPWASLASVMVTFASGYTLQANPPSSSGCPVYSFTVTADILSAAIMSTVDSLRILAPNMASALSETVNRVRSSGRERLPSALPK